MPALARLLVALTLALLIWGVSLLVRPWGTALVRLVLPPVRRNAPRDGAGGRREATNLLTRIRAALQEERERMREEEEKRRLFALLQGRRAARKHRLVTVALAVISLVPGVGRLRIPPRARPLAVCRWVLSWWWNRMRVQPRLLHNNRGKTTSVQAFLCKARANGFAAEVD